MSIIFTNHAQDRMNQRHLSRSDIERTLSNPDRSFPAKKRDTVKFIREINGRNHQVVAKLLENKKDWLVLSVWVRGEEDRNWVEWIVLLPVRILMAIFRLIFGKK
ncbi:MAG: DUF4258 domain-containing protein [Patescibacteria group bacterium]